MNYIVKIYTYNEADDEIAKVLLEDLVLDSAVYEILLYRNKSIVSAPNSALSISRLVKNDDDKITKIFEALQLSADGDTIYLDLLYQSSADTDIFQLASKQKVFTCRTNCGVKTVQDAGVYEEVLKEEITINFTN